MNCAVCHLPGTEEHFTNLPFATRSSINIFLNTLFSMQYDRFSITIFVSALLNIWCRISDGKFRGCLDKIPCLVTKYQSHFTASSMCIVIYRHITYLILRVKGKSFEEYGTYRPAIQLWRYSPFWALTSIRTSWVHYTTSCKRSLVLQKMGEIIARNMSS